jgi:L-fuculose-phosphate aldolase
MVKVNIHDLSYEGNLKPSTETPLHAAIYAARPNITAVTHNHSTNACIIAAAHQDISPILDDMVQMVGGSIGVSKYGLPGSDELTMNGMIALEGQNAAILANHGPVCTGRNMKEAFVICPIVEKAVRVFVDVQTLGGPVCISDENVKFMRSFFLEEHGQK